MGQRRGGASSIATGGLAYVAVHDMIAPASSRLEPGGKEAVVDDREKPAVFISVSMTDAVACARIGGEVEELQLLLCAARALPRESDRDLAESPLKTPPTRLHFFRRGPSR